MNKRKLKRILDRQEMRTNANRAYSLSMQRRIGKLEESLKALTLRVDRRYIMEAEEDLEEKITSFYDCEPTTPEAVDDHEERIKELEEKVSALQHAACETAREVLEVNDHYRHDQTLPPGEIHLEQDGVTYIHRPDEVIGVDMAKSGCETIITDI